MKDYKYDRKTGWLFFGNILFVFVFIILPLTFA
jgi:hypothetical protein